MTESAFEPNWASPPGETIAAILRARAIPLHIFSGLLGLAEQETVRLLNGKHPIDSVLATRISATVGSTPRFWIERERRFQLSIKALDARRPELQEWLSKFPLNKMREMGWISKFKTQVDAPYELMDFFAVSSIKQWQKNYVTKLGRTNFRTSEIFQNDVAATTAWLRRGELVAEEMSCGDWSRKNFIKCLSELKSLSLEANPRVFLPKLQRECARHGVAVVVQRCPTGCAASGATNMLSPKRALLLLSARFLSDDHFWFSFFHEAAHIILHNDEPSIEDSKNASNEKESEANAFAQNVILDPEGESALLSVSLSKFSIGRLAKKCNVSVGVIVGQLQNRGRITPAMFSSLKHRYKAADFTREI